MPDQPALASCPSISCSSAAPATLTWRKLMPALFQAWRHGKAAGAAHPLGGARRKHQRRRLPPVHRRRFVGSTAPSARATRNSRFAAAATAAWTSRCRSTTPGWKGGDGATPTRWCCSSPPALFPQICDQLGKVGLNGANVRVVLEKAAQPRPRQRARDQPRGARRVHRRPGAAHRPLPRQTGGAEPDRRCASATPSSSRCGGATSPTSRSRAGREPGRGHARFSTTAPARLRDMVQNHALQLLTRWWRWSRPAATTPTPSATRSSRCCARSRPSRPSVARDVVRGQYRAGNCDAPRAGLPRRKVPPAAAETFVALRTEIQNWRWAGVPFYLRTGKRLAARDAQIVVSFRPTPHQHLPGHHQPNKLVIKLQPEDGLELHLLAARGGHQRHAGAGIPRPRFRQGLRREPRRRLRAPAARRHRRAAQPVRAQRRAHGPGAGWKPPGAGRSPCSTPGRRTAPARGRMQRLERGASRRERLWWIPRLPRLRLGPDCRRTL